jgi:PAS domain S-box-containing protein
MLNSDPDLEKKNKLLESENQILKERILALENLAKEDYSWPKEIINSIPNPIFIKDETLSFYAVNAAFCKFVGILEKDLIGRNDSDFFPEDQVKIFAAIDEEVLETGITNWNEEELTVDDTVLNLLTSKVRIRDSNESNFLLGLITDISDNKNQQVLLTQKKNELEYEKKNSENLLMEVHHRVKNNLQVISSLLNLQRQFYNEDNDVISNILNDCSHRVLAMANVHEILYSNKNFSRLNFKHYIETLIDNLAISFNLENRIIFNLELKSFYINVNEAVPLGMAINEIITNAIKYATNEISPVKIDVHAKKFAKYILIEIGDNGGGSKLDLSDKSNSMGIDLIYLFCEQLNAKVSIDNSSEGLKFTIVVPL